MEGYRAANLSLSSRACAPFGPSVAGRWSRDNLCRWLSSLALFCWLIMVLDFPTPSMAKVMALRLLCDCSPYSSASPDHIPVNATSLDEIGHHEKPLHEPFPFQVSRIYGASERYHQAANLKDHIQTF